MYLLILEQRAKKELARIPDRDRVKIERVLEVIVYDPFSGKKLSGELLGQYAVRAWPYRIVYKIYKNELIVSVVHIGHRKDVYRQFG